MCFLHIEVDLKGSSRRKIEVFGGGGQYFIKRFNKISVVNMSMREKARVESRADQEEESRTI
jgi:hypothetical protein